MEATGADKELGRNTYFFGWDFAVVCEGFLETE